MAFARTERTGPSRLVNRIKIAYWAALLIIAAMSGASFLLLNDMLTGLQRDNAVLAQAADQKRITQRIVTLADAALRAAPRERKAIIDDIASSAGQLASGHDKFQRALRGMSVETGNAVMTVFEGAPHHLDILSSRFESLAKRFASSAAAESGFAPASPDRPAKQLAAEMTGPLAAMTISGYGEAENRIAANATGGLAGTLVKHHALFTITISLIALVALTIFLPLSEAVEKRTTDLVEARNSMEYIAAHDGLTGLHNRAFLVDHFETLLSGAQRRGERVAVLQIDLDGFKQINDTLGHAAGDLVLVKTAERMRESCRASDLCVRLGGDEFVMILAAAGATEDINMVATRALQRINEAIDFEGATIAVGASAGIAVFPVDAANAQELLVHSDLALYNAKKIGGMHCFFSDELRQELDNRKMLERDMREAIAANAFQPWFQPQVSLIDGKIAGVEALVRWNHDVRGRVSPGEFLPVAEKTGLMSEIGRIVIAKAIAKAAEWHNGGIEFGRLAVNVSGAELREPDFSAFLFETLARTGLPHRRLSLEIVESVILDDERSGIAAKLRAIRATGIHLELDDFGTGYASLAHVNPNEIDRLKIDRRFVQNINTNADNTKIVRAITELARGLGISIIAEGAETEKELDSLLAIGCENVQGYSIAFPMPGEEAGEWLTAQQRRTARLRKPARKQA